MKKILLALLVLTLLLTGCTKQIKLKEEYNPNSKLHISNKKVSLPVVRPESLANENAVIPFDAYIYDNADAEYEAGLCVDNVNNTVVYAQNPHKQIYPASMTKILTALVVTDAIEEGKIGVGDWITIQSDIEFNESNVTVLGLKKDYQITVDELMHGLLISSYNDCAVVLARYVAGGEKEFAALMNQKALLLGATNSHFVNNHGLHNSNHYTTPYDLYLIFKEFLSKDYLLEIDKNPRYNLTYFKDGEKVVREIATTNAFISNSFELPEGYHITGWKTGTTEKAGSCIIFGMAKENNGTEYICLVSNAKGHNALYDSIDNILKKIN